MNVPVFIFDDLAEARDFVNAIWMAAADIDVPSSAASIRRIAEAAMDKIQAVIDLRENSRTA